MNGRDPVSPLRFVATLALAGSAWLLAGCGRPAEPVADAPPADAIAPGASGDPVVARVAGASLVASSVDAMLLVPLHDLAMQQHRLRRKALEAEVLRRLEDLPAGERTAELLLEPPAPPRFAVEADPARTRPAGDAPVTVLAFCNFESAHCARLQQVLAQVLPLFPGVVRYAERDLPMEFHRHAAKAAEAARCAAGQGAYWRFHDLLYASGGTPDRPALERAARGANLEMSSFTGCLDSGRHAAEVAADAGMARSLGAAAVPLVLVNGLYASPDVRPGDLVWLVERELTAQGAPSPREEAAEAESTAPFQLWGLLASSIPGQGVALVAPSIAPGRVQAFREGDSLATNVVVRRILPTHVELWRDGTVERLGWPRGSAAGTQQEDTPEETAIVRPHRAVPVTLDRQQVLVLMSDRIALEEALVPVEMTVGPYHLLRITGVAPGGLYELLGFEPRDVLISVNEQPVHEASNPLWEALEKEGEVRVRVVRPGGLARHFTYRFDD